MAGVEGPTATELAALVRERKVSPLELLEGSFSRIDSINDELNAIIWRNDEEARSEARRMGNVLAGASDASELPPFYGVPLPIKDLTEVAGWPVFFGSRGTRPRISEQSALVVEALQRAGFLLTARTNAPEFGPIPVTENLRFGITRNPHNSDFTPGGSSGGAAAAVASGMFSIAHGNDGGGSLRIPASCCGLVGFKASRGRVPSRTMSWEGASVEGVLTRDVADQAAVLDVISGPDRGMWYNAPVPNCRFSEEITLPRERVRVGVTTQVPFGLPLDPECLAAVELASEVLEGLGHHVFETNLNIDESVIDPFVTLSTSGLAGYEGIDWEETDVHIRRSLAQGEATSSLDFARAVYALQRFTREFVVPWGNVFDYLLTPTMSITPPEAGSVLKEVHEANGAAPSLSVIQMAVLTMPFNVTGQPAISLPVSHTNAGVPVGIQLVGGPFDDGGVLALAHEFMKGR